MIEGLGETGYLSAQQHYRNLKNKMLNEFTLRLKLDQRLQNVYRVQQADMEANILSEASSHSKSFGKAAEALDSMEMLVGDIILNNDVSGLRNLFNEMTTRALDSNKNIEEQRKNLKTELKQSQTAIFQQIGIDKSFFNQVVTSTTSGDVTDIVNQLTSYFTRRLYDSIMTQFQLTVRYKYLMSLSGFYKEATEYEVLSKHFGKALNVFHAGSKNTELDVIITSLDNLETALSGNTEITKQLYAGDFTDLSKDLINQINWFGEQVKSWNLNSQQTTYHIGNRNQLFQSYLAEKGVKEDWSTADSARFLARFENILLALGPSNVLFSSNGARQWTCDFIKDFREKNYYLVFGRKSNKTPLTASVDLEAYLTEKKQIRKRFLT